LTGVFSRACFPDKRLVTQFTKDLDSGKMSATVESEGKRPSMADLRDRFLGAILGCAVGDALGAPFEGEPADLNRFADPAEVRYRKISGYPFGQYTDDTQLTLAIVKAICRSGDVDGAAIAEEFVKLWQSGEIVGAGASCSDAVNNIVRLGVSWRDAGTKPGRAGNGAAMRAGPIGLWDYANPDRIERDAEVSGVITHKDPRAVAGAIAVARAVALCVNSEEVEPAGFLANVSGSVRGTSGLFADCIDELGGWLNMEPSEALPLIYASGEPDLGERKPGWVTAYVVPTVLCALYCFVRTPRDFVGIVTGSICAGGDADTVAAIAGAIGGAYNGLSAIPRALIETLKDSEAIISLSEKFYDVTMSRN
jgi:ADP-ribosylglycohydrolase